jgi:hypothetical protein
VDFLDGENLAMVKSFIRGLAKWPSADLAELLVAIKRILDTRAAHHAEGGGIEAEVAGRPRKKLPRDAKQNA